MSKYWEKRLLQLEAANYKNSQEFVEFLYKEYDKALHSIDLKINKFIEDIAVDNKISMAEAKRLLNQSELKGFKMGLERFTELAKQGDSLSAEVKRELDNASRAFRISKLQAQELEIKAEVDRLLNMEQKETFKHLKKQYQHNYYRINYDLQKIVGFKHINGLSSKKLDLILNRPWAMDGKNFSERIWGKKDKLINELHKELTQGLIRGDGYKTISRTFAKRFDVSKSNAKRLILTESAFINSKATSDSFKSMGVKKYEIVATLDLRTSDICRQMDGRVFDSKDEKIGINSPPFHPYCRTVTIPYFDDDIQRELEDTRMARDPVTGKSGRVKNMDYNEWYGRYVVNDSKVLAKEKANRYKHSDKLQYDKYKNILGQQKLGKFDDFQDLKYNNSNEWGELRKDFGVIKAINKNKNISSLNRSRAIDLYYNFKESDIYASDHFIEHFIGREFNKSGELNYTFENIVKICKLQPNYVDIRNNRKIIVFDGMNIIKEGDKYISMRRGRISKHWKKI